MITEVVFVLYIILVILYVPYTSFNKLAKIRRYWPIIGSLPYLKKLQEFQIYVYYLLNFTPQGIILVSKHNFLNIIASGKILQLQYTKA